MSELTNTSELSPELQQAYRDHTVARAIANLRLVDTVLAHDVSAETQLFISPDDPTAVLYPNPYYRLYPNITEDNGQNVYKGFSVDTIQDTGGARHLLRYQSGDDPRISLIYQEFVFPTTTIDFESTEEQTLHQASLSDYSTELVRRRSEAVLDLLQRAPGHREQFQTPDTTRRMSWIKILGA